MKKIYSLLAICILLTSCFDLFDPAYWKDGDYILSSNPREPGCLSLTNDGIVLLDCVKSIGSNKEYIIALETNPKKRLNYWIIKKLENKYKEKPEGPFGFEEFVEMKKKLSITDLKFEREFGKN